MPKFFLKKELAEKNIIINQSIKLIISDQDQCAILFDLKIRGGIFWTCVVPDNIENFEQNPLGPRLIISNYFESDIEVIPF